MSSAEDRVTTLREVMEEQVALEKQARAIAKKAGGRENVCTYNQSYITQPVYSCETCAKETGVEEFGFCFGCSMHCHLDHNVTELFNKRHFRCDCGNQHTGHGFQCMLAPEKEAINSENRYNHNFKDLYCRCRSTYEPETDLMYQCLSCQDWFHQKCVSLPDPDSSGSEFMCGECVKKLACVHPYIHQQLLVESKKESVLEPSKAETPSTSSSSLSSSSASESSATTTPSSESSAAATPSSDSASSTSTSAEVVASPSRGQKRKEPSSPSLPVSSSASKSLSSADSSSSASSISSAPSVSIVCTRPSYDEALPASVQDWFFTEDWRQSLCRCERCLQLYKDNEAMFLLEEQGVSDDEDDLLNTDEDESKQVESSDADPSFSLDHMMMQALSALPRDRTIDVVMQYRTFMGAVSSALQQYIAQHPDQVISKEAVQHIIAQVVTAVNAKRQRT